jgi:fibronectin-binding autotransporter adhesin
MKFLSLMRAQKKSSKNSQRRRPSWQAPLLEPLEDRALPSTLTVTSAADDGSAGTLRAVLAAAHNGDTIVFSKKLDGQTITLTAGQLLDNASVQINGPGSNQLTISGNSASTVFDIAAGVTTTISGLTVSHGFAIDGGGILNAGTLTLSQDVLTANVAQGITGGGLFTTGIGRGGAVYNQAGATLNVVKSTLTGNIAYGAPGNIGENGYGGGIYNQAGTVSVSQSVLTGNQAIGSPGGGYLTFYGYTFLAMGGLAEGGAIDSQLGVLNISGSTIKDNTAQGGPAGSTAPTASSGPAWGGGIASGGETLSLTSSTLSGNQALGGAGPGFLALGGGLFIIPTGGPTESATIGGTIFANNRAATGPAGSFGRSYAAGGGADCEFGVNLQMNNCIFTGNSASADSANGGGLYLYQASSPGSISNTTFTGNLAQGGFNLATGGGLELFGSATETLNNCNFAQNMAESIPGSTDVDALGGGLYVGNPSVVANNCNFTQNIASTAASAPLTIFGTGASGLGGGIEVFAGSLTLSNSTITGNQAIGGPGGPGGTGGLARGAGLDAVGSSVAINNTTILGNLAQAGPGSTGEPGGYAHGGGVFNGDSTITITNSTLADNSARGGAGGAGAAGGVGQGGGYYSTSFLTLPTSVSFQNSLVTLNQATGGAGGSGASGGNADGGCLFIDAGTSGTLLSSAIIANQATGGAGGSAGQGVGGGAYNLGTLDVDALSIIFANLASTSNNNVFGPITPI